MCFNALISNTDDHPRNHAVIARDRDWRLSPAYDLVPAPQISLERRDLALIAGDQGRYANARNLLSQAVRFLLTQHEADQIIGEMKARIQTTWHQVARGAGVTEQDCERIATCFAYPGFDLGVVAGEQA